MNLTANKKKQTKGSFEVLIDGRTQTQMVPPLPPAAQGMQQSTSKQKSTLHIRHWLERTDEKDFFDTETVLDVKTLF